MCINHLIFDYFFRGIIIGILFGLPVGAVGAMTIQRAWSFGFRAGLITGLGSSAADCFYAIVGAFGLTVIYDFLMTYQRAITIAGGILVLCMGIRLFLKKESGIRQEENPEKIGTIRLFFSSFAVGITNPAAILTFLFAFTIYGISDLSSPAEGALLVLGVLLGTLFWWISLSLATCAVKRKANTGKKFPANRLFGCILVIFSLVIFLRLFK